MFLGVLTPGTRCCKPFHGLPLLSLHSQVLTHLRSLLQVINILLAYTDRHFVQLLSRVWLFVTPWTAARQPSLSFTISRSLQKPTSTASVMPSRRLILCRPLLLLPSTFPRLTLRTDAPSESSYPCLIALSEITAAGVMIACIWLKDKHLIFHLSIRCVLRASDVNMCLYVHENKCRVIFDQVGTASQTVEIHWGYLCDLINALLCKCPLSVWKFLLSARKFIFCVY